MKYQHVGKIHSAQGIRGELFIYLFARQAFWEDQWKNLAFGPKGAKQPQRFLEILSKRKHRKKSKPGFVLKLESIHDRHQAEELAGCDVFIPENFLTTGDDESFYLREVLGFQVLDQTRGNVGEVVGFSGSFMQDILVIRGVHGEFGVPFVFPIYRSTNKEKRELVMDIPQGLVAGEVL